MRSTIFASVIAIALSSCSAGLKSSIQGKWERLSDGEMKCTVDVSEKYRITDCSDKTGHLYTVTTEYEIIQGDRIVYKSKDGDSIADIKIDDNTMKEKGTEKTEWQITYRRIK